MKILDLRGTWRCSTDEAACFTAPDGRWEGTSFVLPGSACENGIGTPLHYSPPFVLHHHCTQLVNNSFR